MKHRQTGISKVGLINTDGHAIGLDLGATSARAAILAPGTLDGHPSVTVHGLASVPLPPGCVVNGVVIDQIALTKALKNLWQENKFACKNVILGIASPQVLVRDMQIPDLSPQQRALALPFQAREIVALPMDQVVLDFAQLGEADPDTNLVSGLLIATPRQPVLAAVEAVERAGLKVARVDLASFAALRSIADEHLSVEAVVDMGAHLTTIVIHNRGVPKLVRTLARGGQELSGRLVDRLSLSAQDAETVKFEVGLLGGKDSASALLSEAIRPLLAEIRSSINYFISGNGGTLIERISLTGGASGLHGLADLLSSQVGVPTNVVTPMRHICNRWASTQVRTEDSERWASAVSVGLAMGAAA
ncbi:MAG: type IV pilus assembly protein PilM [Pseudonocardiales bacterium]|nr:type IV pilus assembly protein PilM [Actinomycetota bacterium]